MGNSDSAKADVLQFREIVETSFQPRLNALREEIDRLRSIQDTSESCFQRYVDYTPVETGVFQKVEFEKAVFGKTLPARRFRSGSIRAISKDEIIEQYPKRKALLWWIIKTLDSFYEPLQGTFIRKAVAQYTIWRCKLTSWEPKTGTLVPYNGVLLSPRGAADFLADLYRTDRFLARRVASVIALDFGEDVLQQGMMEQDEEMLTAAIEGLGARQTKLTTRVTALRTAVDQGILVELSRCKQICQPIREDFFLLPEFQLDENDNYFLGELAYYSEPYSEQGLIAELDAIEQTISSERENAPDRNSTMVSSNLLGDKFPQIKQKFQDERIAEIIIGCIAGSYIDETPETQALFKYRVFGIGELPQQLRDQKIIWYIPAGRKHPGELNGLLLEILSDTSNLREYIAKFFAFATGKNDIGEPVIIDLQIEPPTQHNSTKLVDALAKIPELERLF